MKEPAQYHLYRKRETKDSNKFSKYVINLLLQEIKPFKTGVEEFKNQIDAIELIVKH